MCTRTDCATPQATADHSPCLNIGWVGYKGPPVFCKLPFLHCKACADKTTITDVLTDEGWGKIVAALKAQGSREPSRALTRLVFKRLDVRNEDVTEAEQEALKRIRRAYPGCGVWVSDVYV